MHENIAGNKRAGKSAEKDVREDILNSVECGLLLLDDQGRTVYANRSFLTWFAPFERIKGEFCWKIFGIKDPERECAVLEALQSARTIHREIFTTNADGGDKFFYVTASPVFNNGSNRAHQVALTVVDITDRKREEEQMLQAKQDWENTFNNISDIITIHDKNFNIILANKAAEDMLGLRFLEIKKAKCYESYHGTDCPPENCPSCDSLQTENPVTVDIFEPHLNRHIEVRSMPRYDNNKRFSGVIHVVRDVTDRKQAERMNQRQLKRLSALHSIEKAVNASLDLNAILDILLDSITTHLEIDAAAVLLMNHSTQNLEYVVSKGFYSNALKYTHLRLGESNAGRAAVERRIVTIPDLRKNIDGFARSEQFKYENFITYFGAPLVAKGEVMGVLELFHRTPLESKPEWLEFFETIADQAATAIHNASLFEGLQRSNSELVLAYDSTIVGWSLAMEMKDKETEGHSRRVTDMTLRIAEKLGVKDEELVHIRRGALLHDIGKMGIPDSILLKPDKLTDEEWEIMKRHPEYAYNMLKNIEYLKPALDIPWCHHEKWDGTGYPRGLKGSEIPLAARIFAVVDVWDALCSDRPYRPAWPARKVFDHIRCLASTHFDSAVVGAFLKQFPAEAIT